MHRGAGVSSVAPPSAHVYGCKRVGVANNAKKAIPLISFFLRKTLGTRYGPVVTRFL